MSGSSNVAVWMAFGVRAGTIPDEGDWVEVSEWLHVDAGSVAIECTSGRTNSLGAITPGTAKFRLVNTDRRFDPRYAAGPYYGNLVNGVPVRIVAGYDPGGDSTYGITTFGSVFYDSAVTAEVRWTGVLDSGWPQDLTAFDPVIDVECVDTLGLMHRTPAPETAYAVELAGSAYAPDAHWKLGADGWIDALTGARARHTSGLVSAEPLIDGGDSSFQSDNLIGNGIVEVGPHATTTPFAVAFAVRLTEQPTGWVWLYNQVADNGVQQLAVGVHPTEGLHVVMSRTGSSPEKLTYEYGGVFLGVGAAHHIAVVFPVGSDPAANFVRVWVDGALMTQTTGDAAFSGGASTTTKVTTLSGNVDSVAVWSSSISSLSFVPLMAWAGAFFPTLGTAARRGWANQRLDQRLANIARGQNLPIAYAATFDTSGTVTQQAYRKSEPLQLLKTIEDTEQGRISADRNGLLQFAGRGWAWNAVKSTTLQATFSDDPTTLSAGTACEMESDGTVITDRADEIVNVASVNSTYGRQQTARDQSSIDLYGERPLTLTGLLHDSDRKSLSIAEWYVYSRATPTPRVEQLTFDVASNYAVLGPLAQTIEEGWLIKVHKEARLDCDGSAIGSDVEVVGHVTSVKNRWTRTRWLVTLTIDSTRAGKTWFTWGTSTWGGSSGWAY